MAKKSMQLEIVSAEAAVFSGQVSSLVIEGQAGELGIHPGHTPLLTPVKPGQIEVTYVSENTPHFFYISGGMLEVQPGIVTILADTAQRAEDLDEAAAMIAKEAAEKRLADKQSGMDYTRAMTELAESIAQLKAIRSMRNSIRKH